MENNKSNSRLNYLLYIAFGLVFFGILGLLKAPMHPNAFGGQSVEHSLNYNYVALSVGFGLMAFYDYKMKVNPLLVTLMVFGTLGNMLLFLAS